MRRLARKGSILALAVALLVALWHFDKMHISVSQRVLQRPEALSAAPRLGLDSYVVTMEAHPIRGLKTNVSGLTYSNATGTLFAVVNRPPAVAELSTQGELLRRWALPGLGDPEGITHVEGHLFLVSDESDNSLHRVVIAPGTLTLEAERVGGFDAGGAPLYNLGFEGASWDESRAELLLANEKWPRRVLIVQGLPITGGADPAAVRVERWRPAGWLGFLGSDLASLTTHPQTGNLLLLGEESAVVSEYSRQGALLGVMPLSRGSSGLQRSVPQPEGIALGPGDDIFIVSEPNLLYRFSKVSQR